MVKITRTCVGDDCSNNASALQCPKCLALGKESYFCSQDCFKRSWATHKTLHKSPSSGKFNPFPTFKFTGSLRPLYPLSPRREVPASIELPDYAKDGIPHSEQKVVGRHQIAILDAEEIEGMRKVCRYTREVLDIAARELKPGVTTDYIDEVVHNACLERNVVCHGIPDQRPLIDGDIVNIDVSLYHGGFHGDLNETYYVGPKALADPDSVRVVETARQCLNKSIELVKPDVAFKDYGGVIEKHAKSRGCSVVTTYCGHGVNRLFHAKPNVPHYAKNKAKGIAKPGMCFTIEPMINLGASKDMMWPDDWTSATVDGRRSAQFEHTLLVTEDGVEVLTARLADSPGGPVPEPVQGNQVEAEAETNGQ
ncbi:MAG: Methionine aminopeptidase 1 [Vezdaea aestivalis]|nr:MAG: Methionine aminopeptidase 1 [Vezdaea aestivalis]